VLDDDVLRRARIRALENGTTVDTSFRGSDKERKLAIPLHPRHVGGNR